MSIITNKKLRKKIRNSIRNKERLNNLNNKNKERIKKKKGRKKLTAIERLNNYLKRKTLSQVIEELSNKRKIEIKDIIGTKEERSYRSFVTYARSRLKALFKLLDRVFEKEEKVIIFRLDINSRNIEKEDKRYLFKNEIEVKDEELKGIIGRINNNKRHNKFLNNIREMVGVVEEGEIKRKSHGHFLFIVGLDGFLKGIDKVDKEIGRIWLKDYIERMKLVIYRMLDNEYRGKDRVRIFDIVKEGKEIWIDCNDVKEKNEIYVWGAYLCKERKDKNGEKFFITTRKMKSEDKDLDNYDCITL